MSEKMKPTQQEIIELAREAGFGIGQGISAIRINGYADDLLRLAELLLERFGAGGGEPVYAFRRKGQDSFCTCDENRYLELSEKPNLFEVKIFYTSPTDLRAEYLRGVEDAAKVARAGYDTFWQRHEPEFPKTKYDQASVLRTMHATVEFVSTDIADAIEALKGKQ